MSEGDGGQARCVFEAKERTRDHDQPPPGIDPATLAAIERRAAEIAAEAPAWDELPEETQRLLRELFAQPAPRRKDTAT